MSTGSEVDTLPASTLTFACRILFYSMCTVNDADREYKEAMSIGYLFFHPIFTYSLLSRKKSIVRQDSRGKFKRFF